MKTNMILSLIAATLLGLSGCGSSDSGGDNPTDTDPTVNSAPVVDAGNDMTVQLGDHITLSGSASDIDGTVVSVVWEKDTVQLAATPTFTYTPTSIGTELLTFTATDDKGASTSDTVTLTVSMSPVGNTPPQADAGSDLSVQTNDTLTITGSGIDSDGTIVSYRWTKDGVELATTATFDYTPTVVGTDTLTFTVTDDKGATASDTMVVTVSAVPVPNNAPTVTTQDLTTDINTAVTVTSNANDSDGSIVAYSWSENSVVISTQASFSYTPTTTGDHTLTITVTDDDGATATATLTVTANDPAVDTPPVITIIGENPYTLVKGTAFTDPGATALDNEDGVLPITTNNSVDTSTVGTYTVVYSTLDSAGHQVVEWRQVNVVDSLSVVAVNDIVTANSLSDIITVDVRSNDTLTTATVTLLDTDNDYGVWSLSNNQVTYTPHANTLFKGGEVFALYQISDGTNSATAAIFINYPVVLEAKDDSAVPTTIAPYTINVINNDTHIDAVAQVQVDDYGWKVEDDMRITYTPPSYFGGGPVNTSYTLVDTSGRSDSAEITLNYPKVLYAAMDSATATNLTDTLDIDVLANDTITANTTISYCFSDMFTCEVNATTKHITVTPAANFGGGMTYVSYIITDGIRSSSTYVRITYPEVLVAKEDDRFASDITTVLNIDVLANDVVTGTPTVQLRAGYDSNTGADIYDNNATTEDGHWQVEADNTVTFTPNSIFAGDLTQIEYKIIDSSGRESLSDIYLSYPTVIKASDDYLYPTIISTVNITVLNNDTYTPADLASVVINSGYDGTWSVEANNSITFTPDTSFKGGETNGAYTITNTAGREDTGYITITYPYRLKAYDDQAVQTDINQTTSYNVVSNDIADDTPILLELAWGGGITEEGNWSVENNTNLIFAPNASFGGGDVYFDYTITDAQGRMEQATCTFTYPLIVKATTDLIQMQSFVKTDINILANDTFLSLNDTTVTLDGQLQSSEGNWTLNSDKSVSFTPAASFGGGYVYMPYTLTDITSGRKSTNYIFLEYPVAVAAEDETVYSTVSDTTPVTIDVLLNDTYTTPVTITFSNGLTTLSDTYGDWSIDANNKVVFTPTSTIPNYAYISTDYTITDQDGRTATAIVTVAYWP